MYGLRKRHGYGRALAGLARSYGSTQDMLRDSVRAGTYSRYVGKERAGLGNSVIGAARLVWLYASCEVFHRAILR